MLSREIEKISEDFLDEAHNSPKLMCDMAAMEKYMAESYADRTLIELIQNADDASSTKAVVYQEQDFIVFANDGRPFDEDDVIAICRSGASNKVKGINIGHRGVGFKSTTALSNNIIIYSNDTFFTFSKSHCAGILNVEIDAVPTVRVPFLIDKSEIKMEVINAIKNLEKENYSTFFVFLNANKDVIDNEVNNFDKSCMIFLNHLKKISFRMNTLKEIEVNRKYDETGETVLIVDDTKEQMWWLPKKSKKILAFKLNDKNEIIECENDEAVFHNFMPTVEKTPYLFKINADFSTDPSRKSILNDENTKNKINEVSTIIFEIIQSSVLNEWNHSEILRLFTIRNSYNAVANLLYDTLNNLIKNSLVIHTTNGEFVNTEQYYLLDETFDLSEKIQIREFSNAIRLNTIAFNNQSFEYFIGRYSNRKYEHTVYLECLKDGNFIKNCDKSIIEKMYSLVIKKAHASFIIDKKDTDFENILDKDTDGDLCHFNEDNLNSLKDSLTVDELKWFTNKTKLKMPDNNEKNIPEVKIIKKGEYVSKWKSAEQQVVDIENISGNKAEYVGNKNLGYDVLSVTPDGKKRYIEVKLLSSDKGEFSLTNNEYTSAHEFGKDYILCLIVQKDYEIKLTYIEAPLEKLKLEKRVRQWEWYCNEFDGEVKIFKYK